MVVVFLAVPFLERLDVLGFTGKAEKERLEHELKSKMLGGSIFKSCHYMLVPWWLTYFAVCMGSAWDKEWEWFLQISLFYRILLA